MTIHASITVHRKFWHDGRRTAANRAQHLADLIEAYNVTLWGACVDTCSTPECTRRGVSTAQEFLRQTRPSVDHILMAKATNYAVSNHVKSAAHPAIQHPSHCDGDILCQVMSSECSYTTGQQVISGPSRRSTRTAGKHLESCVLAP